MISSISNRCLYNTMAKSWVESEILVDRKSKFQARCCAIKDCKEIPTLLQDLVDGNKSLSKASHPHMYAWRTGTVVTLPTGSNIKSKKKIKSKNDASSMTPVTLKNIQQGFHDCGESGAGQRLLTLLERAQLVNVLVIVTRWYGGTPLGPSRFRHISSTAAQCLKKGNFM